MAILPLGTRTAQVMTARTAYADADADVFPVDAQMTALAPSSAALLIAIVIPRSLHEPVGFAPSTLRYTSQPVNCDTRFAGTSGVPPSSRVTTGVAAVTGRRSRYSSINPRHARAFAFTSFSLMTCDVVRILAGRLQGHPAKPRQDEGHSSPSTRMTLATSRTFSRPRSPSTVADSAASGARWVTTTS